MGIDPLDQLGYTPRGHNLANLRRGRMHKPNETTLGLQTWLPWIMFSVAALFYCFVYFLRVSPGMMTAEIQQHFGITATKLGLFATLYYAIYSPTQLIVGSIIDCYGPRIVLFSACMVSLMGIYLFGTAESFYIACAGRLFIGLGSAFGYVTILKVASTWLPPRRFAAAAGLTTAFGMSAAILTETYLARAIKGSGFHSWFVTSTIIGLLLATIILLVLRNKPNNSTSQQTERMSFAELKKGYKHIITNPQCWYIGIVGALLYMPAMVFLDVGGPDYFHAAYGLNKSESAIMVNMMFLGWIIGSPIIGMYSDHIKRRKSPLVLTSLIAMFLISAIFYLHLPMPLLVTCMLLLGFTCGAHPLVFSLGKENSPLRFSGTATAFVNFLVMSGGWTLWLYGRLLDLHWDHTMSTSGAPIYSLWDYRFALSVIPIGLLIALAIASMIKETHASAYIDNTSAELEEEESDNIMPQAV